MTVYEYPGYQADADLTASVITRLERVQTLLSKVMDELDKIQVSAEGADGDVVLSVDHAGQLTTFSLAEGCTVRYTNFALEHLINTTLREAVNQANEQAQAVTGADGEEELSAAIDAFADPDSHIWSS